MSPNSPPEDLPNRLTRTGAVWGFLLGLSLPGVLTVQFWAPDSYVGNLVSTARGRGDAVVAIAFVYIVAGYVLEKLGYSLFEEEGT